MQGRSSDFVLRRLSPDELCWRTGHNDLPTVFEPNEQLSADRLTEAVRRCRDVILERLHISGAVLIRSRAYSEAAHLADVVSALELSGRDYPHFTDNYRETVGPGVVKASSVPACYPVPPHTEQAFCGLRPGVVGFMCVEPAMAGGETPLHDTVAVYREMTPRLQEALVGCSFSKSVEGMSEKGILANFGTMDRDAIARVCAEFGIRVRESAGRVSFSTQGPCVVRHPITGEPALSCFWTATSLYYFFRHHGYLPGTDRVLRVLCRLLPGWLVSQALRYLHPYFRRNYRYAFVKGGRSFQLPTSDLVAIERLIWKNTTVFRWKAGDIMLIDNVKVAHSRLPFTPPRVVVACVADYYRAEGVRPENHG